MSYRCDNCNAIRNGKELVKVTEVREVNYTRGFNRINRRDKTTEFMFDSSYPGTEYVSVERLCDRCYEGRKDMPPKVSKDIKEVKFVGRRAKVAETDPRNNDEEYRSNREKFDGRE